MVDSIMKDVYISSSESISNIGTQFLFIITCLNLLLPEHHATTENDMLITNDDKEVKDAKTR